MAKKETRGTICKLTADYAVIDAAGLGSTQVYAHRYDMVEHELVVSDLSLLLVPGSSVLFVHERVKQNESDPIKRQYRVYAKEWKLDVITPSPRHGGGDVREIENGIGFIADRKAHCGVIWSKECNYVWFSENACELDRNSVFAKRYEPGAWVQFTAVPQEDRNGALWRAIKVMGPMPGTIDVQIEPTTELWLSSRKLPILVGAVYKNHGFAFGWSPLVGRVLLNKNKLGEALFKEVTPLSQWCGQVQLQSVSKLTDCFWHALTVEPYPTDSPPLLDQLRVIDCHAEVAYIAKSYGILKHNQYGSIFFNFNDIHKRIPNKDLRSLVGFGSYWAALIVPQITTHGCCWRALYVRPRHLSGSQSASEPEQELPVHEDSGVGSSSASPTSGRCVDSASQTEPGMTDKVIEIVRNDKDIVKIFCEKYPVLLADLLRQ